MADVVVAHRKHPHYNSTVASGVGVGGPSVDNFVQLTFFREMVSIEEEYFDRTEEPLPSGAIKLTVTPLNVPPKMESFREDVVTVLIPKANFAGFAESVARMDANLRSIEVGNGDS